MGKFPRPVVWLVAVLALALAPRAGYAAETRFALVIGNDEYKTAKLATPANDAGLIADALQAAGFTVTGARNLDQATLRESFREFLSQVAAAGPDAVALVYLSGVGLQFAGENYFVPVDADIQRDVDVPLQAVRISDFTQPLAALPGRVKIVILDAARQNPFARGGEPLAGGLALVDPVRGMAIAFNAAPGTVAPDEQGPYGAYATSLTEMIAAGGLSLDDLFARVRLRVSELSQGAEVPWYVAQIDGPFFMTERAADAPPPPNVAPLADIRGKAIGGYSSAEDAYAAALELDTLEGYQQYLVAYPNTPFARRIAAMLAVRREEIIWRRCVFANTPPAYWSYLRRYPNGPHAWDARRRLTMLAAVLDPPASFAFIDFGVPLPPPAEMVFLDQPVVMFVGPGFAPPPPPPVFFLPVRPREFAVLPPPPAPRERFFLPTPPASPVHAFVRPPPTVTLRGAPPGGAAGRPMVPVALPGAVQSRATPGASGTGTATAPAKDERRRPAGAGAPPAQPPTALVKPAPPPPAPPPGPSPAVAKPAPPPPPPPPPAAPKPALVKPAPPPPPPPPPAPAPKPAVAKPAPPPPPPPPPAPAPKPAAAKPAPPPPPPPPPAPAAKPACPPGKTPVTVNGRAECK
ncbi:MAG TPA: caspase domain-containing protein [Xanthobacteraceae bacterium]|nr:caspase domain-containing protein [Xanthobacteraceae bacterium]